MERVGRSLIFFGVYILMLGLALMLFPEVLNLLQVDSSSPWIRVAGLAVGIIGAFYIVGGRYQFLPFAKLSLITRSSQLIFFIITILSELLPTVMLVFALIEFFFGVWTYVEIKRLDTSQ